MTVIKTTAARIWAAGGRQVRVPVAAPQPGRGEALCDFAPRRSQAAQIGDLAGCVGGVKALAETLRVNRGTLQHIIDGDRPVPLALWQSLTGVDAMRSALADLEKRRAQ